ncbi:MULTISPECIES: AAA family ATPase [unclassified Pseudomonas]|uniref:AAA family ATPase n=1 Tax=unclassified Pseudomonas TaxID=196821 RepID=UPI0021BAFAB4|nr:MULTISPECIES: AAA family ATPase [unclassified Pseudomonas]MCT8163474.1 AAA family ATPase [Pseudomonas sp. HD6422]MCT8182530.1 AAA family ATPase [Pseudomonas sp. HD6421]
MKVSQLRLINFRGISDLSVDFTERTTAFVGVNGVGKSTVLDALAIGLSQLMWRIAGTAQKARPIATDDIRAGADFARVELTVILDDKPVRWAVVTNQKKGVYSDPLRKSELDALNEYVSGQHERWVAEGVDDRPLAVFYDVNRAVLDVPMRVREKLSHDAKEIYQDALDHGGADFKRFFIWFRNFEDAENEVRIDDPDFRYYGLEAARKAILEFTGFEGVRVRRKPKMRMTVRKRGGEFNVLQLSDGERNMLALVGDMARRLSVLNPALSNPNQGAGIVIIDEVDLHLHPRWQREVVKKLESTFPNCQFFISTHSPQVIGELAPESVMLLKDGRLLGHARRAIGLSSGEILEELMEGTARNDKFQSAIDSIQRDIEDERFGAARDGLKKVSEIFGPLPEVLRLEESLEWYDPTEKLEVGEHGSGNRT